MFNFECLMFNGRREKGNVKREKRNNVKMAKPLQSGFPLGQPVVKAK